MRFPMAHTGLHPLNLKIWLRHTGHWVVTLFWGGYLWTKGKALDLPIEIESIEVMPVGTSSDDGYVRLLYAFSNDKACDEEIKRKKSTNL